LITQKKLEKYLRLQNWKYKNLLMMSSGEFDGINYLELIKDESLNNNRP
jgi:hypothetical protein